MSGVNTFTLTLLRWFNENGRELPWRGTRDPYAIWLSEVILQQTQVKQGWDYWLRFMRRWPTVQQLAEASEDEVLRYWQGLGYYSRARNLHAAARQVVAMGGFPRTVEGLKQLKGVGDYTAAAIASIAFGEPVAVVDGNVYRVLARHFGIATPINTTDGRKEFAALAQSLIPLTSRPSPLTSHPSPLTSHPSSTAIYNQAIMDFGAIQCTPSSPACSVCPLQDTCSALRQGTVEQLPVKLKTVKVKERRMTYVYVRHQGQTAIRRRGAGDIWQGLYEPLLVDGPSSCIPMSDAILVRHDVRHVLTHRVILADLYLWQPRQRPTLPDGYFWIPEDQIDRYAVPRLVEILLHSLCPAVLPPGSLS